ncbi:MAG TPA: Nif3-like dinuclear metal center hexameric protein [Virgibacillus sp.]|nr:Nif3-like dinuclear metal center hexameric protein [Virgibacillus sp.]
MINKVTAEDIFKVMEDWAPTHYAYDWDNVGLQIGSYTKPVSKIMITLDVLDSVVDEAIANDVDLIIAHHPLLFKPLKELNLQSPQGRVIQKLIKHDITVYASHTNLDVTNGGVNDMLCDALQIHSRDILVDEKTEALYKIVFYVPESHEDTFRETIGNSGAGHIGNYSHCTFQSSGQGTFKPLEGTNPYIGSTNELEKVNELRMETIVKQTDLARVIDELITKHPYEEPAYDIYLLANKGDAYGLGRIGILQDPMTPQAFADHVKNSLNVPWVRMTRGHKDNIKTVAVLGGSGEGYFKAALNKGADAYITGDVTFHIAQDADELGLSIVDPGHHVEKVMKQGVKDYLMNHLSMDRIEIITSTVDTEPFSIQ